MGSHRVSCYYFGSDQAGALYDFPFSSTISTSSKVTKCDYHRVEGQSLMQFPTRSILKISWLYASRWPSLASFVPILRAQFKPKLRRTCAASRHARTVECRTSTPWEWATPLVHFPRPTLLSPRLNTTPFSSPPAVLLIRVRLSLQSFRKQGKVPLHPPSSYLSCPRHTRCVGIGCSNWTVDGEKWCTLQES